MNELGLFGKALACKKVKDDIYELLLMIGFGIGMRFRREGEKEDLYFDKAIIMVPVGGYEEPKDEENKSAFQTEKVEKPQMMKPQVVMYVQKQFFDDELMLSIEALDYELERRRVEGDEPICSTLEKDIRQEVNADRNIDAIETEMKNRRLDLEKEFQKDSEE